MSDSSSEVDVYIGVGSNIDPERNIPKALELLARRVALRRVSTFYRTEALGEPKQSPFLNGVCKGETSMAPRALKFEVLRPIEESLGRRRTADRYAPRTIDLDILLYGDAVISEPGLRIPDPDIRVRPFVFVPLLELAPDLSLPDSGETLADVVPSRVKGLRDGDAPVAGLTAAEEFSRKLRERLYV